MADILMKIVADNHLSTDTVNWQFISADRLSLVFAFNAACPKKIGANNLAIVSDRLLFENFQ